jgi:hypothetical protein
MDEHLIESCLQAIEEINDMLDYNSTEYQRYIESAQSVMFYLDTTSFFDDTTQLDEQTRVIETLQRLAFIDSDAGSIDDVAAWCLQKWLMILQLRPQTVPALKGLLHMNCLPASLIVSGIGKWWLSKAQRSLARINAEESSSSSSSGGATRRPNSDPTSSTRTDEVRRASRSTRDQDAETRLHSQEYVEARGLLLPAIEYLTRAVEEGDRQGITDGSLFVTVSFFLKLEACAL